MQTGAAQHNAAAILRLLRLQQTLAETLGVGTKTAMQTGAAQHNAAAILNVGVQRCRSEDRDAERRCP